MKQGRHLLVQSPQLAIAPSLRQVLRKHFSELSQSQAAHPEQVCDSEGCRGFRGDPGADHAEDTKEGTTLPRTAGHAAADGHPGSWWPPAPGQAQGQRLGPVPSKREACHSMTVQAIWISRALDGFGD